MPEFASFHDFLDWVSREIVKEMSRGKTAGSSHKVTSANVKTEEAENHVA